MAALTRVVAINTGSVVGTTTSAMSPPRSGNHGPSSATSEFLPAAKAWPIATDAPNARTSAADEMATTPRRPTRSPASVMIAAARSGSAAAIITLAGDRVGRRGVVAISSAALVLAFGASVAIGQAFAAGKNSLVAELG